MLIVIRPATLRDIETWVDLRLALWPSAERAELALEVPRMAENPDTLNLIAWDGDEAVGLLEVEIRAHAPGSKGDAVPYLEGWYVAEGQRRQGVGGALVRAAEEWARRRGFSAMASDTSIGYPDSPAAHAALGYEVVATSDDPDDGFTWHFYKRL